MRQRILLVEDDRALAKQVIEHLGKAGFATDWWDTPQHLDASALKPYGLIILDLMLPNAYGLDLLKALRIDAAWRTSPPASLQMK